MFSASRRIRSERTSHRRKATALIMATLVFANVIAIAGLGASARAGDFPDALQYAPMTWEKEAPLLPETPAAAPKAAPVVTVAPVERRPVEEVAAAAPADHRFSEVRTPVMTRSETARHRDLLIALMSIALGTMAGVSFYMFRSLAREIDEAERKRGRR